MWLRRTKSTTPFQHSNLPPFSCSSFKDIQSLFEEETNTNTNVFTTPKSPCINVFHRIRSTKSLLHALSNLHKKPPKSNKDDGNVNKDNGVVLNVLKRGLSEGNKCFLEDSSILEQVNVKGSLEEVVDVDVDVKDGLNGVVEIELPGTETRVVIFFTSLRVVRSTFEDCKYVRTILHSFPVAIDERDLSMDMRFMKELERIMGGDGDGDEKGSLRLPRVFIGGRYMGGAEEIRQLHEAGELKKYLVGLAPKPPGTCEVCGGHGFVLCGECNGSHKCYVDKSGFRTCNGCNENGLVRCSSCSSLPL